MLIKPNKKIVHFIYTVPRGSFLYRLVNKMLSLINLPPLYRYGWDSFICWRQPIRAPHSISYNILQALKQEYRVRFYSMYEKVAALVGPDDLILAQPAPVLPHNPPKELDKRAVTYRTFVKYPDNKKIIIMPYSGDVVYTAWWKDLVKDFGQNCLFFSGQIWFDRWDTSPFKDLSIMKKKRLNMGINLKEYPWVKKYFNPKGRRGYLYIGHSSWYKNISMLEAIAKAMPEYKYGHVGGGSIKGWEKIADFADLNEEFVSGLSKDYDIFVNVSRGDPQVTTVLEAMAFGFLTACTPESGYEWPAITKLDTDDLDYNCDQLRRLQNVDENEITNTIKIGRQLLMDVYSWEGVKADVLNFIKSI